MATVRGGWVGFVLKVVVGSTLGAIALKTLGPALPLAPTAPTALVLVLSPPLLLALALAWQSRTPPQP